MPLLHRQLQKGIFASSMANRIDEGYAATTQAVSECVCVLRARHTPTASGIKDNVLLGLRTEGPTACLELSEVGIQDVMC